MPCLKECDLLLSQPDVGECHGQLGRNAMQVAETLKHVPDVVRSGRLGLGPPQQAAGTVGVWCQIFGFHGLPILGPEFD
jgi:hypothetical protein